MIYSEYCRINITDDIYFTSTAIYGTYLIFFFSGLDVLVNPSLAKNSGQEIVGTVDEELCLRADDGQRQKEEDNSDSEKELTIHIPDGDFENEQTGNKGVNTENMTSPMLTDEDKIRQPLINGCAPTGDVGRDGQGKPEKSTEHNEMKKKIGKNNSVNYCYVSNL